MLLALFWKVNVNTATAPTESTQENAAQIDQRKKNDVHNLDFPKIIDLSKLHTIETTTLEPFLLF